ncbi:hypothetical protein MMB17_04175 [Methylobacterium organophilum]|uniref:hypothetical protein n=1 Tax=Methylobacterium organophilum TaxID=410 RepID=UPI001F148C14|nr:hypothetical protein [Methylobacterium organophilum]UMY18536.1 hypothetical protein MMB17_04175 [Methylobacterium organophilum]
MEAGSPRSAHRAEMGDRFITSSSLRHAPVAGACKKRCSKAAIHNQSFPAWNPPEAIGFALATQLPAAAAYSATAQETSQEDGRSQERVAQVQGGVLIDEETTRTA